MDEPEPMSSPSVILQGTGEEVIAAAMKILELRLNYAQGCIEAVKKMPPPNFNQEQCGYLVNKLDVVVLAARSFLEISRSQQCGADSSWNVTKWVGIFKLLLALGKQIEDFIAECSKSAWVEAAMTLSNVVEYVSSLGFNLELCKALLLEGECAAMLQGLTLDDVDTLNKAEVEMVRVKAIVDKEYLLKKVTLALDYSDLAKYLLRRLLSVHPKPMSNEGNILGKLFAWVVSDMRARQLGRGSSAAVYEVTWLGIPVAQKIFFGVENRFFLREVGIISQLCHPNITSMFASTMNKGNCSIIMELMDVDLYVLIQSICSQRSDSPPFSISVSLDLMLQIAKGVNYLHTKRIIHRDLKSKNILVKMVRAAELETRYLQVKVVDFGLSKTKERIATDSCMTYNQGTDRWMAPELVKLVSKDPECLAMDDPQCLARSEGVLNYKFKCDVYSFAMVCYEILTGEVPFKDVSDPRKIKQLVLNGERPGLPSNCPAMLKALIEKCWNGNSKERPSFGTICSTLQYLKYMSMRGNITPEGLEARLDNTLSEGSGCLAEVVNSTCLSTVKVDVPSSSVFESKEVDDILAADCGQDIYTYETFKSALSTLPTMEELETMNDPTGQLPQTEEEINAGAMDSIDFRLKLLQGCIEAVKKMPPPNFNQKQCEYLVDKLEVVVQVARSFFEVSCFNHCGPDSSWNVSKWVGIFKLLLTLGKRIEGFVAGCSMAAWLGAALKLTDVAEYVSSLGFNLELCRVVLLEGECAAMLQGLTLDDVDTLNEAEVEMVRVKAIVDKEYLLKKVTLASDSSDLSKYLRGRLLSVHPNPICDEDIIIGNLFDRVESDTRPLLLGRGSSGSVYKVMWLGTPMAKKTFFGEKNKYFLKEVSILSRLRHPNIISMFACSMDKRSCSIIMDLMDGDLFALMHFRRFKQRSDSPPFSIFVSLDLMLQIATGVNYLHTKRIVHRDLKSHNVLVKVVRAAELDTEYLQAKVADFVLSKTKEYSVTYSHMTYNTGTNRWMAPELIKTYVDDPNLECLVRSEGVLNYNFKCDVYSFAMVCYEILTGEVPFKDESDRRKIRQLVLEGKRPELPTNCPHVLKTLIEKCWSGNPAERPSFGTICSTLQYLKYMLMRGDITPEVLEAKIDHTLSDTLSDGSR